MIVPATRDTVQETGEELEVPEIRVWCHPLKVGVPRDDYYCVFPTFAEALRFISVHPEAEKTPMLAFRGYELNLWAMQPEKEEVHNVEAFSD